MFENKSEEEILQEALALAPAGIDTREGSIYYDAIAGVCAKIASLYADISAAFDLVFISTAVGEYLDEKGGEFGVYRNQAKPARYEYIYNGSAPETGARFFANEQYFTLTEAGSELVLEAEEPGSSGNDVPLGTAAVPVENMGGLVSCQFGNLMEPGMQMEEDEDFRQRIREKLGGPAENGNRQHYKTWCEEIAGVGRARIVPLFAGESTVMAVLTAVDGKPATKAVVDKVQEYVDPITKGIQREFQGKTIVVGDGLGNGVANIGAHFLAAAAEELPVTISFCPTIASTKTVEEVKIAAQEALSEYLLKLALETAETEAVVIRISTIGALIYSLPGVIDYTGLSINGQTHNLSVGDAQVAVLAEVEVNEAV